MQEEELEKRPKDKKGRGRFLAGVLTGVVGAVAVIGAFFVLPDAVRYLSTGDTGSKVALSMLTPKVRTKVRYLTDLIDRYYYEDVDRDSYSEGLYEGLFSGLDKYSEYYSRKDYEKQQKDLTGVFAGIGIGIVADLQDRFYITQVYEGTPAEEAGLQIGDELIKADEYDAKDMELEEFVSHVQGKEGTTVKIMVRRVKEEASEKDSDGVDAAEDNDKSGLDETATDDKNTSDEAEADDSNVETITVDVKRAKIEVPTVLHEMLSDDIGYISIDSFTSHTDEQFGDGVKALQGEGMKKLIIDLRDNGGGDFNAACDTLDVILPSGLMIYTEDRQGERQDINGTDDEVLDVPIVVLVNGNSASSSEVFAGGLHDRDVATLVGTRTFGKGILQSVYQMPDGSGFQLTTQRFFTAKGYAIQDEHGIAPDVEVEYEYTGDRSKKYDYMKDNQVLKAIEILND